MVIVEFFSQSPIENMIGTLANAPERTVFVGEMHRMKKCESIFRRFLDAVGNTATQLEYRGIKIHEFSEIIQVVEQIALDYPGSHFDLTGGDALAIAAVGVVYERYREQGIELHQYNIRTGKVYDCDMNGQTVARELPALSVEQNIILHGGSVVAADRKRNGTYDWDFNDGFLRDVSVMWEICRRDCGRWNLQTSMLGYMLQFNSGGNDSLCLDVVVSQAVNYIQKKGCRLDFKGIFYSLGRNGLIRGFRREGDMFHLEFKDGQVKRCLTKAGTILELVTLLAARAATGQNGACYYSDSMTGVFLDWDGVVHGDADPEVDTENEIDIILMHGAVPVFISCKNGAVAEDELYKLNTVVGRFGGAYARKALVATTLGKKNRSRKYFLERAKDMHIQVIDGVQDLTDGQFRKKLKALA